MGFEDRDYFRSEHSGGMRWDFGGAKQTMVVILVIVNIVVFVLDLFTPVVSSSGAQWLSQSLSVGSNRVWHLWTYLTYGFAHASYGTELGIKHIIGNMITLFFLGMPVEQRLGRNEFLKFYLVAVIVGGVGWQIIAQMVYSGAVGSMLGASGAVSAVVLAFILMFPNRVIHLMGVVPIKAWVLGILMLLINLMHALDEKSQVSWETHAIGAAFGAAYVKFNWNLRWLQFGRLDKMFGPRTKLRIHNPGESESKLQQQGDEILAKISREGESSLTAKERRILNKYSKQIRKNRDS